MWRAKGRKGLICRPERWGSMAGLPEQELATANARLLTPEMLGNRRPRCVGIRELAEQLLTRLSASARLGRLEGTVIAHARGCCRAFQARLRRPAFGVTGSRTNRWHSISAKIGCGTASGSLTAPRLTRGQFGRWWVFGRRTPAA
jgi:hypothetical protein